MAQDVVIRLSADASGVQKGVHGAVQSLGTLGEESKKIAATMGAYLGGALSIGAFTSKLVSVQREFDVLNSSLITVTGSSTAAAREFAWIKEFAATTPYALNEVTQAFVRMKSLGLDATEGTLRSYGNTASAMGKSLDQMIEAVADASTGEFERLKEFGIRASKEGDRVSLTFQGVTKTIGNSAAEIAAYLRDIGETQFGGAMAERAKTLDGALSNLGDTWDGLFLTISQQNAGGLIYDSVTLASAAIGDAIDILDAMNRATEENAKQTGAANAIQEGLAITFETVAVLGANVAYVLEGIGREIGGLAAQAAMAAQLDFSGAAAIGDMMKADAAAARAAVDAQTAAILNARTNAAEYRQVLESARAGTIDYSASVARLIEMQNAGTISAQQFRVAVESLQPAAKDAGTATGGLSGSLGGTKKAAKEANDAIEDLLLKLDAKEVEEATKAVDDYNRAWSDYLGDLDKTARGLDEQIEQYGMTDAQIAAVTLARAEDRLEMSRASEGVQPDYLAALEREVELRRQIAGSAGNLEVLDANARAAKDAEQEWRRTAAAIEDSLIDALMDGGKSGAEYIEGLFRTMVLRPVLQAIVSPVANTVTSAMGFAPPATSSSGVSMPMPSMGGLVGNGLLWAGGALGTGTALGGFATGMGTAFASGASTASTMAAGSSLMGTAGGGAAGAGMMAGAALPWIGAALAIASMIDWGGGTPHAGAVVLSDGTTTSSTRSHDEVRSYYANPDDAQQFVESDFTKRYQQGVADALTPVAIGLADLYNSTLSSFGLDAGYTVGLGFSADDDDASRGRFSIIDSEGNEVDDFVKKFSSDPEAGMAGFIDASAVAIRDALVAADLPGWVDSMLTDLGDNASVDSLNLALMQAQAIEDAAQTLGPALGITAEGLAGVVAQADSFDVAMAGLNTLSASYLTAGEQWTAMQTAVADQFSAIGQAVPQSTDAFRRLLTEIDLTGEAGQDLYADLLNLAPAFFQVASAVEQAFASISQITATSVRDIEMSMLDQAGQYAYLDAEVDRLMTDLSQAVDPASIQAIFEQINTKTMEAYNLLAIEEQQRLGAEFIDRLYDAEAVAQSRLEVYPVEDTLLAQQTATERMGAATEAAAQKMIEAAERLEAVLAATTSDTAEGVRLAAQDLRDAASNINVVVTVRSDAVSELS